VKIVADDQPLPARRVTIPAGDALDVPFQAAVDVRRLTATVDDPEGYPADNARFTLAETRTLPRILIVSGGPGATDGFYLSRALLAEAEDGPDFEVSTVTGGAFAAMPADRIREQSVVMLLSTHGLDRRVRDNLRGFLEGGGGVFIAAGQEVDPAVVSTLLDWQPPLAPREMRDAGVLAATDLRHPVFRPFDAVAANFGQVLFDRAWQVDAGPAWRVVARYTNGGTAVAERLSTTSGRVLLFTSDLDRKWNDFPLNPAFVPFTQEVARYLGARPPAAPAYLVAEFQKLVTRSSGASQPRAVRLARQTEGQQNYWRYGLMLMLGALVVEAFLGSRS
jgi:hypothetical protein